MALWIMALRSCSSSSSLTRKGGAGRVLGDPTTRNGGGESALKAGLSKCGVLGVLGECCSRARKSAASLDGVRASKSVVRRLGHDDVEIGGRRVRSGERCTSEAGSGGEGGVSVFMPDGALSILRSSEPNSALLFFGVGVLTILRECTTS